MAPRGRPKGRLNTKTLQRLEDERIAREQARTKPKPLGGKLPSEILLQIAAWHMGIAAKAQRDDQGNDLAPKVLMANRKIIDHHLERARLATRDAAPYYEPRLASIKHSGLGDTNITFNWTAVLAALPEAALAQLVALLGATGALGSPQSKPADAGPDPGRAASTLN